MILTLQVSTDNPTKACNPLNWNISETSRLKAMIISHVWWYKPPDLKLVPAHFHVTVSFMYVCVRMNKHWSKKARSVRLLHATYLANIVRVNSKLAFNRRKQRSKAQNVFALKYLITQNGTHFRLFHWRTLFGSITS